MVAAIMLARSIMTGERPTMIPVWPGRLARGCEHAKVEVVAARLVTPLIILVSAVRGRWIPDRWLWQGRRLPGQCQCSWLTRMCLRKRKGTPWLIVRGGGGGDVHRVQ
jgi:hypothetical protein